MSCFIIGIDPHKRFHTAVAVDAAETIRLAGPGASCAAPRRAARRQPSMSRARVALPFEDAVSARSIVPAFLDVMSHEHDVRAALASRRA
jgi:hypothetical protein